MLTQILDPAKTPSSDTGLISQQASISVLGLDYLTLTAGFSRLADLEQFADYLVQFGDTRYTIVWEPNIPLKAGVLWEYRGLAHDGIKIGVNRERTDGEITGYRLFISLPGQYWHTLGIVDHWRILNFLFGTDPSQYWIDKNGCRRKCAFFPTDINVTRIDIKFRDFTKIVTPAQINQFTQGGFASGFRKARSASEWEIGGVPRVTAYLGASGSEKQLRIYDAEYRHGISAIDWELECRDEKARMVAQMIADFQPDYKSAMPYSALPACVGSLICGAVCFHDIPVARMIELKDTEATYESIVTDKSRVAPASWWSQMVEAVGGAIKVSSGQRTRSLSKSIRWFDRQVAPMLAAFRQGMGAANFRAWLDSQVDRATERFSAHHEIIIQTLKFGGLEEEMST